VDTASASRTSGGYGYGGASAAAIRRHYDLGHEFYALWLDPSLTYSCALWDGPDDNLAAAQQRKLSYLASQARVTGADRVLDVGCGWGSMLRHLRDREGVTEVVGLTLSREQAGYASHHLDERCQVLVQNWADHDSGRFDAVISIGAFEHFARYGMSRAERLECYRAFFARCGDWLPRGHRLVLQTNTTGNNRRMDRNTVAELTFIIERIFQESVIPGLSEVLQASENRFDVVHIRNDPEHYARTCQAWHDGLASHQARAAELVGEQVVADYLHYLSATVQHFRNHHLGLARLTLVRV
jgi:cyclopropane-fatty-acyl-phospholipid synthase